MCWSHLRHASNTRAAVNPCKVCVAKVTHVIIHNGPDVQSMVVGCSGQRHRHRVRQIVTVFSIQLHVAPVRRLSRAAQVTVTARGRENSTSQESLRFILDWQTEAGLPTEAHHVSPGVQSIGSLSRGKLRPSKPHVTSGQFPHERAYV